MTHARRPDPDPDPYAVPDDSLERRRLRVAIAAALVVHALLLVLPAPHEEAQAAEEDAPPKVVVLQPVRFKPPPEPPPEPIPQEEVVEIPVPDPTPDEIEPIRPALETLPVNDDIDWDRVVWEVPTEPPPPPGPILVGGEVARPRAIHTPEPPYTEIARRARIQGVVILQLTLNKGGEVRDVRVLKGLPMGLTEAAVETVSGWRYEPALLNHEPVDVYMTVTINYQLN